MQGSLEDLGPSEATARAARQGCTPRATPPGGQEVRRVEAWTSGQPASGAGPTPGPADRPGASSTPSQFPTRRRWQGLMCSKQPWEVGTVPPHITAEKRLALGHTGPGSQPRSGHLQGAHQPGAGCPGRHQASQGLTCCLGTASGPPQASEGQLREGACPDKHTGHRKDSWREAAQLKTGRGPESPAPKKTRVQARKMLPVRAVRGTRVQTTERTAPRPWGGLRHRSGSMCR